MIYEARRFVAPQIKYLKPVSTRSMQWVTGVFPVLSRTARHPRLTFVSTASHHNVFIQGEASGIQELNMT